MKTINQLLSSGEIDPENPVKKRDYTPVRYDLEYEITHAETDKMHKAVQWFINDVINGQRPYNLSLLGKSGTGKTHLATRAIGVLRKHFPHRERYIQDFPWSYVVDKIRQHDHGIVRYLINTNHILALDDVFSKDESAATKSAFQQITEGRLNKWTIYTSNFTLAGLDAIEARTASRLVRGESKVVTITDADDYCMARYLKQGGRL